MLQTAVFDWSGLHGHGPLWFEHLRLRKRVFVDGRGWKIPHTAATEWDQYDTGATVYAVTHDAGRVVASSRALPCDFQTPVSSYMIRDAARGLLPGIPSDVMADPPTTFTTWEATRFAVCPDLDRAAGRRAMQQNAQAILGACADRGASTVIALMPPAFVRLFNGMGIPATGLADTVTNVDGERFRVMGADVTHLRQAVAA